MGMTLGSLLDIGFNSRLSDIAKYGGTTGLGSVPRYVNSGGLSGMPSLESMMKYGLGGGQFGGVGPQYISSIGGGQFGRF